MLRSDQWDLKLNDPDLKYFKEDDAAGKADLLRFLVRYHNTYAADKGWVASALLAATAFSMLGWMRERNWEKYQAVTTAPLNVYKTTSTL